MGYYVATSPTSRIKFAVRPAFSQHNVCDGYTGYGYNRGFIEFVRRFLLAPGRDASPRRPHTGTDAAVYGETALPLESSESSLNRYPTICIPFMVGTHYVA